MSKISKKSGNEHDWNDDDAILGQVEGLIDTSPLHALNMLRGFHINSMKGHHKRTKATIVHAYACALKFKHSKRLMKKFYNQDFFAKRKHKLGRSKLLSMTMCFIGGSLEGSDYGQAQSYARAVRPFYNRNADPSELREALLTKSIDELEREDKSVRDAQKLRDPGRRDTASGGEPIDTIEDNLGSEERSQHETEEQESEVSTSEADRPSKKAAAKNASGSKRFIKLTDLRLQSTADLSMLILEHPDFDNGLIEYERIENEAGFKQIIVTDVRKL